MQQVASPSHQPTVKATRVLDELRPLFAAELRLLDQLDDFTPGG